MKTTFHKLCFFLIILVIFILVELVLLQKQNDPASLWCDEFIEKNSNIRMGVIPKCNYTLKEIYTDRGISNQYYCFPSDDGFHFERNTMSPFFKYTGNSEQGKSILQTNFPQNKSNFRIIVIGDSVSEGAYVKASEAYYYILEKKFKNKGYDVEILNAAHGCYGIENYYHILKKIIHQYEFDYLILGLNSGDESSCWEAVIIKEITELKVSTGSVINASQIDIKNICLSQMTPNYLNLNRNKHVNLVSNTIYRKLLFTMETIFPKSSYYNFVKTDSGEWQLFFSKMISMINDKNISVAIILFPNAKRPSDTRNIEGLLSSYNLTFINLIKVRPDYLTKGLGGYSIPQNDMNHPNLKGHKIIAEVLYDALLDHITFHTKK